MKDALARHFGSVGRWRAEFMTMGARRKAAGRCVLLTRSPSDRLLVVHWAMDHATVPGDWSANPGEHSYHMDGTKAAAYVDAFMVAINWAIVQGAYDNLRRP